MTTPSTLVATLTLTRPLTPQERLRLADLLAAKACEITKGEAIGTTVHFHLTLEGWHEVQGA